jgi:signal peptidase I
MRPVGIVFAAVLVSAVIRTALFTPMHVTSESMEPTLLVGDYLVVAKSAYGYSRYALPFSLPLFSGRVLASDPHRGDVVVFRYPKDDRVDYVKRIIGLPGDRIQLRDDLLYINDVALKRERIERTGEDVTHWAPAFVFWRETLPDGVSYTTELPAKGHRPESTETFTVPAGHYFIIGDDRDNSSDSRNLTDIGYVPAENLIGRAEVIALSMTAGAPPWQVWRWPTVARSGRWLRIVR